MTSEVTIAVSQLMITESIIKRARLRAFVFPRQRDCSPKSHGHKVWSKSEERSGLRTRVSKKQRGLKYGNVD